MPDELRLDDDARQPEPVHRERGDLGFRQHDLQRHGLERAAPTFEAFVERFDVGLVELDEFAQFGNQRVEIGDLLGDEGKREDRLVVCEQHAVTIEDQPARRADRLHLNPVLVRARAVFFVVGDLQVDHPRDQHEDREQREQEQADRAAGEVTLLPVRILDVGRSRHPFRPGDRGGPSRASMPDKAVPQRARAPTRAAV